MIEGFVDQTRNDLSLNTREKDYDDAFDWHQLVNGLELCEAAGPCVSLLVS